MRQQVAMVGEGRASDLLTLHLFLREAEMWPVVEAARVPVDSRRARQAELQVAPAHEDGSGWLDAIGDFWLWHPRAVQVSPRQAVLVYGAEITSGEAPKQLAVASFYVRDSDSWRPTYRHIHPHPSPGAQGCEAFESPDTPKAPVDL